MAVVAAALRPWLLLAVAASLTRAAGVSEGEAAGFLVGLRFPGEGTRLGLAFTKNRIPLRLSKVGGWASEQQPAPAVGMVMVSAGGSRLEGDYAVQLEALKSKLAGARPAATLRLEFAIDPAGTLELAEAAMASREYSEAVRLFRAGLGAAGLLRHPGSRWANADQQLGLARALSKLGEYEVKPLTPPIPPRTSLCKFAVAQQLPN